MYTSLILPFVGAALAAAQVPPPPVLLTATESGVLPVLPTGFAGVETEEGAIIYDGPANPGFTGLLGNAVVQAGLPAATYVATLPADNFDPLTGSTITGNIAAVSAPGGTGVTFTVNFTGFPAEAEYGPFVYHIHEFPVPADGNCTATVGHLDPTDRGEYYPCVPSAPETCQAGDLAGKHGNITGTSFVATYSDNYLSTVPGSPYYFGDLSVVIHSSNTTRLTCANFVQVGSTNSTTTNSTTSATPTSTIIPYTGAANHLNGYGAAGILAAGAAFFL